MPTTIPTRTRPTLSPLHHDCLRRVAVGVLAGGAEDHATHCRLRTLRKRGLVTMEVVEGEPVWTVTDAGRAVLARRERWEERVCLARRP